MNIERELKDSINTTKQAKILKEKYISDAKSEAKGHWIRVALWVAIIIGAIFNCSAGVNIYINVFWIVVGIIRIVHHILKQIECKEYASSIEGMSLMEFKIKFLK